ncbi:SBBP repeat-containing protein [Leptospira sp. WS39.C2]
MEFRIRHLKAKDSIFNVLPLIEFKNYKKNKIGKINAKYILIFFYILIISFLFQCKPSELNNPTDLQSKSFLETQILKCMLNGWDCIELPQNNQGNKQWTKIFGQSGTFQTYGNSTAVERTGNVYMVGTTTGSILGQTKISPTSENDIVIAKFKPDGKYCC